MGSRPFRCPFFKTTNSISSSIRQTRHRYADPEADRPRRSTTPSRQPEPEPMLAEDKVPVDERFLVLEGAASKAAIGAVANGLPPSWPPTARCFFVGFT